MAMSPDATALTYKNKMSSAEAMKTIKAVGLPLGLFGLAIFTITDFASFGTELICPAAGIMWLTGLVVAILMPAQRKEVLNQTMMMCAIYFLSLLGLKLALGVVSGVSSEMIAASYDQAIPTTTGNAMAGYVQNFLWFDAILLPIGQIGMQGKRLFQFKKSQSLQKIFGQKRGLRDNGQQELY